MQDRTKRLIESYRKAMEAILDNHLNKIVLYGSYARGDYNQDSDMDIFILMDVQPEEISYYADKVYDATYDFETRYKIEINPSVQSVQTYEQWKNAYPFFMNIEKDGVAV